jgi:tetratricopeptide (TPR) repeat protein
MAFHGQRRWWEAEQLYKRVLKADDRHFGALYHLGMLYLHQAKFEDAARFFRRSINVDRNSAEAHHHLAVALMALNRPEEAVQRYEKALAIRPDLAETHNNLGHALETLGQAQEAIAHYEKALALKPAYAEAHNNLGNALMTLARPDEAIEHYKHALAIAPRYVEARVNLGDALAALRRSEEAIACYKEALAVSPNQPRARKNLAGMLDLLGRTEEEVELFRQATALAPDDPEAHNGLGIALQALGRLDEAAREFETAIGLAPRSAAAHLNLAGLRRFTAMDPRFAAMKEITRDTASLGIDDRIAFHFALGKAFADVGDPEQSSRHLLQGNSLKRQQINYHEAEALDRLERIRRVFTAELIRNKQGLGDPSPVPVFIIGMPRSGSTLIEQILASHPDVFGAGEFDGGGKLALSIGDSNESEFPDAVKASSGERLRELGASYLQALRQLAPDTARITDKMLGNFALAGLIHLALPNARIIHARRDPRDTALSCFSTLFTTGLDHTYDLAELGRYYRAYQRLMEHWRDVLPRGAMLEVQYEEVVDNLQEQARRIIAHCGLPWDDACLGFHKTERRVRTASAIQVRQPIYHSSIGRWRDYEPLLQPFVQAWAGT